MLKSLKLCDANKPWHKVMAIICTCSLQTHTVTCMLYQVWNHCYSYCLGHHQCSKPKLKELVLYSAKISSYWKEIALQLDIPQEVVNTIDIGNTEVKEKCYHMFQKWLESTINACWCHFVSALKKVKLNEIAREAEQNITSKLATICIVIIL